MNSDLILEKIIHILRDLVITQKILILQIHHVKTKIQVFANMSTLFISQNMCNAKGTTREKKKFTNIHGKHRKLYHKRFVKIINTVKSLLFQCCQLPWQQ